LQPSLLSGKPSQYQSAIVLALAIDLIDGNRAAGINDYRRQLPAMLGAAHGKPTIRAQLFGLGVGQR
jgi:hypothetical protein